VSCPDFDDFKDLILQYDQKVAIDADKDKKLRYNVWETTVDQVKEMTAKLTSSVLPDKNQSPRVRRKIDNALKRIKESIKPGGTTQADIFNDDFNIEMSIALHELMESVKGESDKARNLGIEISRISDIGVLPSLPMSRVAASIGRKIAFQKGYRFKRALDDDTAVIIESIYYEVGRAALQQLENRGYVKVGKGIPTIMDYQNVEDLRKDFPNNDDVITTVPSIALNEKKLGIGTNSKESAYFLNRTQSDLTGTDLGVITEKLRVVSQITQAQTIILPDTEPNMTDEELAQWDDGIREPDKKTAAARKAIYKKPMYVNKAIHGFMQLMNEESLRTGKSATQRINQVFGTVPNMVNSLFGLKRSDNYSIDKKESIAGQNLSKTTPLDDLVEHYDQLMGSDGSPSPLYMPMKIGRNARLYYLNSVLNPHASKQSRYMLTPGEYSVDVNSSDFDFLVYHIAENLKVKGKGQLPTKKPTYKEILGGTELDEALKAYDRFQAANTLTKKMKALGPLARQFEGIDYVTILTTLQAVKDVRNPKNGKVTTEFTVSADATASGGTLTFIQALGTNPNVMEFLQRIKLLNGETLAGPLTDLYGLMSNAIEDFKAGKSEGLGADLGGADATAILKDTLDLLFNKGEDIRELSKDPTMVFIYGQGANSSADTIARSLADRIIDSLDEKNTREYLGKLFKDPAYEQREGAILKSEKELYPKIVEELKTAQLPQTLYNIMKDEIKGEYLDEYSTRAQKVYELLKNLASDTPFRILPAGAVLAGITATKKNLKKYGMPITKIVEVVNKVEGTEDFVLTRQEKLMKTVLDVSTTHGVDAALLYHALFNVDPESGVAVIHDDIRGNVQTVRAMEAAYAEVTKKMAMEYDVHQQAMNALAVYSPEIAASSDFKALKKEIDENVAEKKRIISEMFKDDTSALIGDGKEFETFASVDSQSDNTVQSDIPSTEKDFGDAVVTVTEDGETVEFLAQEYWDNIQSRLNIVEKLRACLN
jgi:hypothetical protein